VSRPNFIRHFLAVSDSALPSQLSLAVGKIDICYEENNQQNALSYLFLLIY
jgi:hypothetical protein